MLNKTQLIGRLGADPEVRSLNDGAKVTNLRLATTETWKDRETGERKERTEWHRVTVWGDGSANYLSHARKGAMVLIEGRLCARRWTDANGAERTSTEVVVQPRAGGQVRILGSRPHDRNRPPKPSTRQRTPTARRLQPSTSN
ncbi:single-stranded DNA-binding protein [Phenylobacterium kunshanense]|uniref:Single-stranded DNA-binding protein n=1 Tax=Phenylobacterium kunshanense TaxID=1445034 RepID=A0A328BGG8_9CAUL|nr:single-stranded DNA-binding protein [Phenylobacterium kunshanense]RAK65649.1 single-stranded DNA-binding protein [Phenylobacterium kunshanense]